MNSTVELVIMASIIPPAIVMTGTVLSEQRAIRALPGSHQRWLWGGIYRLGLIASIACCLGGVAFSAVGQFQPGIFLNGGMALWWGWDWHQWSKKNNDDDFWTSLGRKLKGQIRRLAGSAAKPVSAPVSA